jgi:hypothetical protein
MAERVSFWEERETAQTAVLWNCFRSPAGPPWVTKKGVIAANQTAPPPCPMRPPKPYYTPSPPPTGLRLTQLEPPWRSRPRTGTASAPATLKFNMTRCFPGTFRREQDGAKRRTLPRQCQFGLAIPGRSSTLRTLESCRGFRFGDRKHGALRFPLFPQDIIGRAFHRRTSQVEPLCR